jgi:type VI secretion system protein ImpI/type VI secretion system protein
MRLILKIISYKGFPLADEMPTEFSEQGGSIGRKHGNTMVLADAEHIVSGRHAEICFQNGGFLIKDVSTNGTTLVNSGMELKNNAAPLQSDEILRLGEYELSVKIVADQVSAVTSPFDAPFGVSSAFSDPFAPSLQSEPLLDIPATPRQDFQDIKPLFSGLDSFGQEELPFPVNTPYKEQAPSSPFQDSFIPPDVHVAEMAETNIADFFKGLDGLSPSETPIAAPSPVIDPFFETPVAVIDTPPVSKPDQFLEPLAVSDSRFPEQSFIPDPVVTPAPIPVSTVTTNPMHLAVAEASKKSDSEILRMFLLGAGITDPGFLNTENGPEAMQSIGGLFRGLIEGLMDVLRARAEMKSEFRVSVTTLRSYDNNPLKFNPDVESVLKLLLAPKNPAFTDADTAVKEAFKDIKFHQMAMTAGIQASLTEILSRFNPDGFEKRLGEGLIFQRKARCWELYCEQYPELKNLALDEFFGDQFAEAYEKQMLLLSKRQS